MKHNLLEEYWCHKIQPAFCGSDTGAKGLDLYCLQKNGEWRFVNSGRPGGKTNQATIIANMRPEEREYMLYLPLYDGLVSLSIGVDSLATIDQPLIDYPLLSSLAIFTVYTLVIWLSTLCLLFYCY